MIHQAKKKRQQEERKRQKSAYNISDSKLSIHRNVKREKKAPKPYFGYSEFVALRMGVFLLVLWLFATDILRTAMCYVMLCYVVFTQNEISEN